MYCFTIEIAHKRLRIESVDEFTKTLCSKFITAEDVDFSEKVFRASETEVRSLMTQAPACTPEYLESLCIYKKIAEWLPAQGRFVFHGASVAFDGGGYIFTAPSGTGKSTHIRLWRRYLGKAVGIVNGDKPVISVGGDIPLVCGTPWAGKENWKQNICVPIRALCFLQRAEENSLVRLLPKECLNLLFQQAYLPDTPEAAALTLEHLDQLLKKVPVYLLKCNMCEEAVQCSFEGLTGLDYNAYRK